MGQVRVWGQARNRGNLLGLRGVAQVRNIFILSRPFFHTHCSQARSSEKLNTRHIYPKVLLSSPQAPNPKAPNPKPKTKGPWADTKILWATTTTTTPPPTFRGPECAYMVQIDALSTPEYQEGVPSHSRWTARGRTWGSPPSSRRTLSKKGFKSLSERNWFSW